MAFQVDCPQCKMQLSGIDTEEGQILAKGIQMEPETFACPICRYMHMEVTIIPEEEFQELRKQLADNKQCRLFVSRMPVFPCPKCGTDCTIRRWLWRKCPLCAKWTRYGKFRWD